MYNASSERADKIFERFKNDYTIISAKVVSYHMDDRYTLAMKLDDGDIYLWDEHERTLRRIPSNYETMTDEQYKIEIGRRLNKMLFRKSISQEKLSEMTGIAQPQISRYVSGKTMPNFRALDRIARALHVSLDELRYVDIEDDIY
jgi:DNA-binding Xre family transcriptional regulator